MCVFRKPAGKWTPQELGRGIFYFSVCDKRTMHDTRYSISLKEGRHDCPHENLELHMSLSSCGSIFCCLWTQTEKLPLWVLSLLASDHPSPYLNVTSPLFCLFFFHPRTSSSTNASCSLYNAPFCKWFFPSIYTHEFFSSLDRLFKLPHHFSSCLYIRIPWKNCIDSISWNSLFINSLQKSFYPVSIYSPKALIVLVSNC